MKSENHTLPQGGRPLDAAQVAVAMARMNWRHDHLMRALRRYVERHGRNMEAKQAVMVAWAFAKLNFKDSALFDQVAGIAMAQKW